MQLYSASPLVRSRQVVADVSALVAIVLSALLGISVGSAIAALAAFGRSMRDAGAGLRDSMSDAASTLEGVPVLGDAVAAPFDQASAVGSALVASGQDQERTVTTLGITVGTLVALIPIALVLAVWLRRRLAFVRRARRIAELASTPGGRDVLALRALLASPPRRLLSVAPDPVAGWRTGDPAVLQALADLEVTAAGVRR